MLNISDMSDRNKHFDELSKIVCVTSGADKPRYGNLRSGDGGILGFSDWSAHTYKPTATPGGASTGSLSNGTYYCCVVVPINTTMVTNSAFKRGQPSAISFPVAATSVDDSMIYTIPVHPQLKQVAAGYTEQSHATDVLDSNWGWATNELQGLTIINLTTGESGDVVSNTSDTIVTDALDFTLGWTDEDEYAVRTTECNQRWIYTSAGVDAQSAWAGPFYFNGVVEDNTTTTYTQTVHTATADVVSTDRLPPVPAAYCHQAFNRIWFGGGIYESRGEATPKVTVQSQAKTVDVTVTTSDYGGGVVDGQIIRYTITAGAAWTDLRRGSRMTISAGGAGSAMNTKNHGTSVEVLDFDDSGGTWIEVLNEVGQAEAGVDAQFDLNPNWVDGNTTGANQTYFTDGFETTIFQFDGDTNGYGILWVDKENQEIGLADTYTGIASGSTEYRIDNTQALSWSNVGDPNIVGIENFLDIPDRITAITSTNRDILLVCENSIQKIPVDALNQGAMELPYRSGSSAPYSVVQTKRGVAFWDGEGFSLTDGVSVESLTKTRADDILKRVNRSMAHNIRCVSMDDTDRLECFFPVDGSISNNFGLSINLSNGDTYPTRWVDVNAVWSEQSVDGRRNIFHGSSSRHTDSGKSYIWEHREDEEEDGLPLGSGFELDVTDLTNIASGYFRCKGSMSDLILGTGSTFPYLHEGGPCTILKSDLSGQLLFAIQKIVEQTPAGVGNALLDDATGYTLTDSVAKFLTDPIAAYGARQYRTIHNLTDGSRAFIYKIISETEIGCALAFGTHSGAASSTVLTDTAFWRFLPIVPDDDDLAGYTIRNVTDGSSATVSSNDVSGGTITSPALSGGTNNEWRAGDDYVVEGLFGGTNDDWEINDAYAIGTDYDVYYNTSDYSLEGAIAVGDFAFASIIPFSYGWKWLDFGSPDKQHMIKRVQIDLEPSSGSWITVEHAINGVPSVVKAASFYVDETNTKIVAPFNHGKANLYGFRIRSWSRHRVKIHNVSVDFTTQV